MDILKAAGYTVYLSYQRECYTLTQLKLQKVLYLAQGWSYVWDNHPLFPDEFEAWPYGPVNDKVYHTFKKYGSNEIPFEEAIYIDEPSEEKETLDAVWDKYGPYSAGRLVELTHHQRPWFESYNNGFKTISNEAIKDYFQSTY